MRSLLLCSFSALALVAQTPLEVSAPITRVRVHPDEAWITRVGTVHVDQAGTYRLEVSGLPLKLRVEDLKVAAKAPEGSRIGDISLASDKKAADESPEQKKIEAQRSSLRHQRDGVEAQQEALKEELGFLRKAMNAQAEGEKDKGGTGSLSSVVELGKGFQARLGELFLRERKLKEELGAIARDEAQLEKQAAAESGRNPSRQGSTRLSVELIASKGGPVELTLVNRTPEARWKPDYEARLGSDAKTLELVLFASVSQRTSEDWNQVPLELSTTRLQRKTEVPAFRKTVDLGWIQSWHAVNPSQDSFANAQPAEVPRQDLTMAYAGSAVAEVGASGKPTAPPPPPVEAMETVSAVFQQAGGLATTFLPEGPKTILADGQPHRVRVTGVDTAPELALVTCPRVDTSVYQVVRFQNPKGLPLFPGAPLHPFAGGQRLPETRLEAPRPGQPYAFSMGAYEGIQANLARLDEKNPFRLTQSVTRRKRGADGRVEERTEQVVSSAKERVWSLGELITVVNTLDVPKRVEVWDQTVRSTQERVEVSFTSKPAPDADAPSPYVRRWTLSLEPGAKGQIQMELTVNGPKDGVVTGLDKLGLAGE